MLLLTKEKCKENVLETMAILPANAPGRNGLIYCISFSSLNSELFSEFFVQGMAMLKGDGKCGRDKKRIIFPFSLVTCCLLILITIFTDVLLNNESESFFPKGVHVFPATC